MMSADIALESGRSPLSSLSAIIDSSTILGTLVQLIVIHYVWFVPVDASRVLNTGGESGVTH